MKSDGDAMETTEPIEAVPDPSSTEEAALEQAPSQPEPANDAAPATNLKANGKPLAADPKTKPKVALNKPMAKSTGASANNSRPGAAPQRGVNDVKALNSAPARKTTTAAKSSSAAGAVPKRPMGVAAVTPAVKTQTKVPEKKPVGQSRTAAVPASPITNGTKQAAVNGAAKMRPGSENPRPKTTTSSRPAASSAPKPNSSTAAKAGVAASSKTSKPLAGPPKARPAPAASRPTTATSKTPTSSAPKTSTFRATTAPPTGKTAVAQPLKTAPPKKDVSRPLSAAAAKKPTGGAAATRKPETSKPTAPAKINSASKLSTVPKASDPKVSQPQNQTDKAIPKKKMPTTARFPANTKPPLGRTPPASPVSKSENSTIQSKGGSKPTQAVLPLTATKKTGYKNMTRPAAQIQRPPDVPLATAPEATVPAEMASEPPESIPQESPLAASVPDTVAPEENTPAEMAREAPPSIPQESLLTAAVQDAVVLAENVATEMAEAPEPIPQELPLTASVAPETNIPAEMAAEAPEPIPQELPLTASVAPETNIPAEMAAEAPESIPHKLPLTASVAPETNIPAEMAAEAPESIPQELPLTASVAPETNIPVEMAEEAPESIPQELSLTPPAPDIVAPETTVSAEVAAEAPSSIPQELSLNAYMQDTVSPEATLPGEVAADAPEAPESTPHEWSLTATVPEEAPHPTEVLTPQLIPEETSQSHSPAPSAPPSSIETALSQPSEVLEHLQSDASLMMMMQEQDQPVAAVLVSPSPHDPSDFSQELVLTEQSPSTSEAQDTAENTSPHKVTQCTLNEEEEEDEDEEERDGSQLISVSEMSGTTQPTEDSRPGSGGPVGGSAWRAGGALLSELDSEEVSGSQQGASELSAPGVLEGTESTDDLGDGSLKGAIDMEGASAGSPDFEKVPDIPVNDFEEDEDDDEDRVCDMDVGSERADEPPRQRHDNDVEDDDDDDVEMASEGITESGLESYGNADEDDFVEDERLDNLNRVGQHPPPPPLLPSAPAAQWDQPNPWAEPPQQVQEADRAEESSSADTWQADSLTPTQAPAQAWLELGLGSFVASDNQDQSQNLEAQLHVGTSNAAPESLFAPRVSLSGTLSSKSSTPEEQPQDLQAGVFSSNPELNYQALVAQMERRDGDGEEDEEAETLPADEVLGGPGTAPASNPSLSSSASEDEPSDTEGEAQLVDSSDGPIISHAAIDAQHASQRCLSTVEEGEEADMECAVEDTTPPSATSLASYGFDTVTTASNSNAHSTGESCIKSPGIFSLEELPDEAKKPGEALQPQDEPCLSEQQYIECGKQEDESADRGDNLGPKEALDPSSMPGMFLLPGENADDIQPPYYSAICEKTENSFTGNV